MTNKQTKLEKELRKKLNCLYLEVDESIADSILESVQDVLNQRNLKMGISQWMNYGKRHEYWNYFKKVDKENINNIIVNILRDKYGLDDDSVLSASEVQECCMVVVDEILRQKI